MQLSMLADPLTGSLPVLNYVATHNVTGVCSNHDQMTMLLSPHPAVANNPFGISLRHL